MTSSGAASSGGTAASGRPVANRRPAARASRQAIPASSASVACTRRRSCSTQRGQLRRWDVEPAAVALADRAVEPVGYQPLRALAPAAARQRTQRLAQLLAGGGQQHPELLLLDRQQTGHLGTRPGVGERDECQGAHLERFERRQGGQTPRALPPPDRPDRRVWRVLVAAARAPSADHNSPQPGSRLRYGKPDHL